MSKPSPQAQIVRQLFRGAVKFALHNSLRQRELAELLKQALVEASIDELQRNDAPVNAARVSVMTGVHRKDVDRIMRQKTTDIPSEGSLVARVIGQWRSDPSFLTKTGEPKILSNSDSQDQFSKLVRSVSNELNPSLVLSELDRVGAIVHHRLGVKLLARAYVPDKDQIKHYQMLADDYHDLAECVEQNLTRTGDDKHLHIKTEYDAIPDSLIEEVSQWLLKQGTAMHEKVAAYVSSKDKDLNPSLRKSSGRNKVSITSFSLTTAGSHHDD
jgi:hypothetical protein